MGIDIVDCELLLKHFILAWIEDASKGLGNHPTDENLQALQNLERGARGEFSNLCIEIVAAAIGRSPQFVYAGMLATVYSQHKQPAKQYAQRLRGVNKVLAS